MKLLDEFLAWNGGGGFNLPADSDILMAAVCNFGMVKRIGRETQKDLFHALVQDVVVGEEEFREWAESMGAVFPMTETDVRRWVRDFAWATGLPVDHLMIRGDE